MTSAIRDLVRFSISMIVLVLGANAQRCPQNCHCNKDIMKCDASMPPNIVPAGIVVVELKHLKTGLYDDTNFADASWENVTELRILDAFQYKYNQNTIQSFYFQKLKYLKILKIFSTNISHLNRNSFGGLSDLRELHFNGTDNINIHKINMALEDGSIVPELDSLVIDNIAKGNEPAVVINEKFFSNVHERQKLQTITLEDLSIGELTLPNPKLLCNIRIFSLKKSTMITLNNKYRKPFEICYNLSYLDITNISIPGATRVMNHFHSSLDVIIQFATANPGFIFNLNFFISAKVLIMNSVFDNLIWPITAKDGLNFTILSKQRKVEIRHNRVQIMNVSLVPYGNKYLEDVDISHNELQYISPYIAQRLDSIRRFVLSNNYIYKMEMNHNADFIQLFRNLVNLRVLDISYNSIIKLPYETFSENVYLTHLNISNNKLMAITFSYSHLLNLEFLGLKNNDIVRLNETVIEGIDILVALVKTSTGKDLVVDLRGNPFECTCNSLQFIAWIKKSPFLVYAKGKEYVCRFEGESLNMKTNAYSYVMETCKRRKIIKISLATTGGFVLVSIAMVLLTRKWRKKLMRLKRMKHFINNIRGDQFNLKFLVFLSFSSDDDDLVQTVVYPELSRRLKDMTQSNFNYICMGDKDFRPGHTILGEVVEYMENSSMVIFVVSNAFVVKPWCQMEVQEALEQQKPIILIITEVLNREKMSPILLRVFDRYTRFKCIHTENGYVTPNWDLLCYSIIDLASKKY